MSKKFKQGVESGNLVEADKLLQKLNVSPLDVVLNVLWRVYQVQLMELDSLPPLYLESPNALAERISAREIYEYAVLLAIQNSDKISFQSYMSILRPYYTELRSDYYGFSNSCDIF